MKRCSQIHLQDAELAARDGLWHAAIGHCLAAETAGAARSEVVATLQIALAEGRSVVGPQAGLADRANFLAIQTMARADATGRDELSAFVADNLSLLVAALETSADGIAEMDSHAVVSRCFDRLIAVARLDQLDETAARRRAAADILPRVDALVRGNSSGWEIRAKRFEILLALDRYRDALNDLRHLAKVDLPDPYVHTNLITFLRRPSHPEVGAAVSALLAGMPQTPDSFETWHHALAGMHATPQSFLLLEKLIPHKPEYIVIKHLRRMADDLDQKPAREFGKPLTGRHLLYASMVCWGQKYLELMDRVSLASLLSPGNFPALCAANDVVLDLFTMPEDLQQILAMPSLQGLAAHCLVRIYLFPEEVEPYRQHIGRFSYQFLGFGSAFTIQRAKRDGADLLFLIPDVVYADGSFSYVASIVTKSPRALMADGLNTAAEPMLNALLPFRSQQEPSLTISIPDLINAAAPHFMSRTTNHFYDPDAGEVNGYPQRVIFCEADGLVVHMFYKLAAYVSHAAISLFGPINYGTPDSYVTGTLFDVLPKSEILPHDGELRYLMIELADHEGRTAAKVQKTMIGAIRNLFLNYGFHLNSFDEFMIGARYPTRVPYTNKLTTPAQREAFLAAVAEERKSNPLYTELCAEREKYGRVAQLEKGK